MGRKLINQILEDVEKVIEYTIYFDESFIEKDAVCYCSAVYIKKDNETFFSNLLNEFKKKLLKKELIDNNEELKWTNIKKKIFTNKQKRNEFIKILKKFIASINSKLYIDYLIIDNYKNEPNNFNVIKLCVLQNIFSKKEINILYKLKFDEQYIYTKSLFKKFNKKFDENINFGNDRYVIGSNSDYFLNVLKYDLNNKKTDQRLLNCLSNKNIFKEKNIDFYFNTITEFVKDYNNQKLDSNYFYLYCQDINSKNSVGLFLADLFVGIFKEQESYSKLKNIFNKIKKKSLNCSIFRIKYCYYCDGTKRNDVKEILIKNY